MLRKIIIYVCLFLLNYQFAIAFETSNATGNEINCKDVNSARKAKKYLSNKKKSTINNEDLCYKKVLKTFDINNFETLKSQLIDSLIECNNNILHSLENKRLKPKKFIYKLHNYNYELNKLKSLIDTNIPIFKEINKYGELIKLDYGELIKLDYGDSTSENLYFKAISSMNVDLNREYRKHMANYAEKDIEISINTVKFLDNRFNEIYRINCLNTITQHRIENKKLKQEVYQQIMLCELKYQELTTIQFYKPNKK